MIKKFLPHIVASLFLVGFVVYAWTEPTSAPPTGNVAAPINIGPTAQTKQGDLILQGKLKVDGNILDKLGNIIYNAVAGKIERARMPFEQGDITSDVDTNTYDSGYFNVSNLIPGNVVNGLAFGRNQTGVAIKMLPGEMGAYGSVGVYSGIGINIYCNSNSSCTGYWYGNHQNEVSQPGEYDPRNILNITISGTAGCYTGFPGNCQNVWLNQQPYFSCAPRWQFYYGGLPTSQNCSPQSVCGHCKLSY